MVIQACTGEGTGGSVRWRAQRWEEGFTETLGRLLGGGMRRRRAPTHSMATCSLHAALLGAQQAARAGHDGLVPPEHVGVYRKAAAGKHVV